MDDAGDGMLTGVRVTRVGGAGHGDGAREWEEKLRGLRASRDSEAIKGGTVLVWDDGGTKLVRKVRCVRGVFDRFKCAIGRGRLARQWDGAVWLREHGFATGVPRALGMGTTEAGRVEVMVLEYVEGETLIDLLADAAGRSGAVEKVAEIAAALAGTIAAMVRAGRFNRDFKPSNLVVTDVDGQVGVAQIDTAAIRGCEARRLDSAPVHMLTCLMLEPTGCGCPPTARQQVRVVRDLIRAWNADSDDDEELSREVEKSGIRLLMEAVAKRVRRHGESRPKDDPRRLRLER